jgi:hypothetical protein
MTYEPSSYVPINKDESDLVQMLHERITEMRPDWPLGDRSDMAMEMFAIVKRWGMKHGTATKDIRF